MTVGCHAMVLGLIKHNIDPTGACLKLETDEHLLSRPQWLCVELQAVMHVVE